MDSKRFSISSINGVGDKYEKIFNENGIYTIYDLLKTYPNRYTYYENQSINDCKHNDMVTILARVASPVMYQRYRNNLSSLSFSARVDNEIVKVIIFNRQYLKQKLFPNTLIQIYGKYNFFRKEIVATDIFFTDKNHTEVFYNLKNVTDATVSRCVKNALAMGFTVPELMPEYLLEDVLSINETIYNIHFPLNKGKARLAQKRIKYEEILEFYIKLKYVTDLKKKEFRDPINYDINRVKTLINSISFELSIDQKNVTNDIFKDFKSNHPMNRLLQGDVGSGKTIVSLISAYAMVTAGFQVVLMAPTEILAQQHYEYFKKYLKPLAINVEILTGKTSKPQRRNLLRDIEMGYTNILIGTHALFYEEINYRNLGFVIIDEQHKFGVGARNKLLGNKAIDALYLTATPIPRSLSLTLFSDLSSSTIKTKRQNKGLITTMIYEKSELNSVYMMIESELEKNHQAYFVVHEIESSGNGYSVESLEEELNLRYPNYNIGILHGKMKDDKKNEIMEAFKNKEIDILISTTVIEVGISVDNATVMAIMDADYFGLATLHQLRGRVARGDLDGVCYLISDNPDKERLQALVNSDDGFELSELDLKMRGPGDYFGMRQSGMPEFIFADFQSDYDMFLSLKNKADYVFEKYYEGDSETITYVDDILKKMNRDTNLN